MQINPLFRPALLSLLVAFLCAIPLFAVESTRKQVTQEEGSIGVIEMGDYCEFLNKAAYAEMHDCYDQKMGADLGGAAIIRIGTPGYYAYEIISGEEKLPMPWLSWADVEQYCAWKKCSAIKEETDPELKSNKVTFKILLDASLPREGAILEGATAAAWEAFVGEALLVTGIISGGGSVAASSDYTERAGMSHESLRRQDEQPDSILNPPPILHLTLTENAEQRVWSERINQIASPQEDYYQNADENLLAIEMASQHEEEAWLTHKAKEATSKLAKEESAKEDDRWKNKDLKKTWAGRIASWFSKAASILGVLDTPVLSIPAALEGASTAISEANKKVQKAPLKQAQQSAAKATQEAEQARCMYDGAEEERHSLQSRRDQLEEKAIKAQKVALLEKARKLKPPLKSSQQNEWREWSKNLLGNATEEEMDGFAAQAAANPMWAAHHSVRLWSTWMKFSETASQDFKNPENQQKAEVDRAQSAYLKATVEAEKVRNLAVAAVEESDQLIGEVKQAQEEYDRLKKTVELLKSQQPQTSHVIEETKNAKKQRDHAKTLLEQKKKACSYYEQSHQVLVETTERLAQAAEGELKRYFQEKESLEEKYERDLKRAQATLEAYQNAWEEVWPEEVLYSKLSQTVPEAFAHAFCQNSEEAWSALAKEAEVVSRLWDRVGNQAQKNLWEKKTAIAQQKKDIVALKNHWNNFSKAVENFIYNWDQKTDAENRALMDSAAEEANKSAKEVLNKVDPSGLTFGRFHRAINYVSAVVVTGAPLEKALELLSTAITQAADAVAVEKASPLWKQEYSWLASVPQEGYSLVRLLQEKLLQESLGTRQQAPTEGSITTPPTVVQHIIYQRIYNVQKNYGAASRKAVTLLTLRRENLNLRRRVLAAEKKNCEAKNTLLPLFKEIMTSGEAPISEGDISRSLSELEEEFKQEKTHITAEENDLTAKEDVQRVHEETLSRTKQAMNQAMQKALGTGNAITTDVATLANVEIACSEAGQETEHIQQLCEQLKIEQEDALLKKEQAETKHEEALQRVDNYREDAAEKEMWAAGWYEYYQQGGTQKDSKEQCFQHGMLYFEEAIARKNNIVTVCERAIEDTGEIFKSYWTAALERERTSQQMLREKVQEKSEAHRAWSNAHEAWLNASQRDTETEAHAQDAQIYAHEHGETPDTVKWYNALPEWHRSAAQLWRDAAAAKKTVLMHPLATDKEILENEITSAEAWAHAHEQRALASHQEADRINQRIQAAAAQAEAAALALQAAQQAQETALQAAFKEAGLLTRMAEEAFAQGKNRDNFHYWNGSVNSLQEAHASWRKFLNMEQAQENTLLFQEASFQLKRLASKITFPQTRIAARATVAPPNYDLHGKNYLDLYMERAKKNTWDQMLAAMNKVVEGTTLEKMQGARKAAADCAALHAYASSSLLAWSNKAQTERPARATLASTYAYALSAISPAIACSSASAYIVAIALSSKFEARLVPVYASALTSAVISFAVSPITTVEHINDLITHVPAQYNHLIPQRQNVASEFLGKRNIARDNTQSFLTAVRNFKEMHAQGAPVINAPELLEEGVVYTDQQNTTHDIRNRELTAFGDSRDLYFGLEILGKAFAGNIHNIITTRTWPNIRNFVTAKVNALSQHWGASHRSESIEAADAADTLELLLKDLAMYKDEETVNNDHQGFADQQGHRHGKEVMRLSAAFLRFVSAVKQAEEEGKAEKVRTARDLFFDALNNPTPNPGV